MSLVDSIKELILVEIQKHHTLLSIKYGIDKAELDDIWFTNQEAETVPRKRGRKATPHHIPSFRKKPQV